MPSITLMLYSSMKICSFQTVVLSCPGGKQTYILFYSYEDDLQDQQALKSSSKRLFRRPREQLGKLNWGQLTKDIEGEFDHEAYWGSGPIFATCEGGAFDVSSEAGEVAIDDHEDHHGDYDFHHDDDDFGGDPDKRCQLYHM